MARNKENAFSLALERLSYQATKATGTSVAFILALAIVVVWLVTGPLFNYSDTWQLVINTGTTIVTFLMVFLIQRAQNKDAVAIHLKLNEIVAALEGASNRLIDVEALSEQELAGIGYFRTENCQACHPGAGKRGIGPDLTKMPAAHRTASWMIPHFKNPAKIVPGSSMPPVQLNDSQLNALSAFILKPPN